MLFRNHRKLLAAWMVLSAIATPVFADCGQIIIVSTVDTIPPPVDYYPPPIWEGFPTTNTGIVDLTGGIGSEGGVLQTYPNPGFPNRFTPGRPNKPPSTGFPGSQNSSGRSAARPTRMPFRDRTRVNEMPQDGKGGGVNRQIDWVNSVVSRGDSFNEPNQYAVVAWNGTEEILWISTRQKSLVPGAGAALSIMPLPGKPISVSRGNDELYKKSYDAIEAKMATSGGIISRAPLLEVKIGAHNIFVLEGKSVQSLEGQIQNFISQRFSGKAEGMIGDNTRAVIADYLSRDFQYFAFDLIDSNEKEEIKVPIQYRFESNYCYYPMVVSKIGGTGKTEVEIVAFTSGALTQHAPPALPFEEVTSERSVKFNQDELGVISPEIQSLFGLRGAVAREWYIQGDMKSFSGDIAWR